MPSTRVHDLDAKLRGYDPRVNKIIDMPVFWLGRGHRILFHAPEEAAAIGFAIDGARGALGARGHVAIDRAASGNRELRTVLEMIAGRKKSRRRVYVIPHEDVVKFSSRAADVVRFVSTASDPSA